MREAIRDILASVIAREGLPVTEMADYALVRANGAVAERPGIRVLAEPGALWQYSLPIPPVRPIDLESAKCVGKPVGVFARVFTASVLEEVLDYFRSDLEREQMGVLHGELALTPVEEDMLPYVLYEAFTPLAARESSAYAVEVGAENQGAAMAAPVAAVIHSHPAPAPEDGANGSEDETTWGAPHLSATDLTQLRRGFSHVHQCSWVACLPRSADSPMPLTSFGYSTFGRITSENGFWIIADAERETSAVSEFVTDRTSGSETKTRESDDDGSS
jgi:hypothetical protein